VTLTGAPPGISRKIWPDPPDRGFLTLACDHPRYLEFAVDLALSLKEHHAEPVALVIDETLRRSAPGEMLALFDVLLPLSPGFAGSMAKFAAYAATPFERTFFIDADCLVIGSLDEDWKRLHGSRFAVQGNYLGREDDRLHHGHSSTALLRRFGVPRYFKTNSGLIYFERAEGAAVAEAAAKLIADSREFIFDSDEVALGLVADAMGVAPIPRPLPCPGGRMSWCPVTIVIAWST
jgi:hypothetical protein